MIAVQVSFTSAIPSEKCFKIYLEKMTISAGWFVIAKFLRLKPILRGDIFPFGIKDYPSDICRQIAAVHL